MAYKTIQRVSVPNLKVYIPIKTELLAKDQSRRRSLATDPETVIVEANVEQH